MARLSWHEPGSRVFEAGVDRGVLYPASGPGVPWNGLVAVEEQMVGGELREFFLDGYKYHDYTTRSEFACRIEAYTYPEEFESCLGVVEINNGLFATAQAKTRFGLAYRSLVGNELEFESLGYKIALIYNASARDAGQTHSTINDPSEPFNFQWDISTYPAVVDGVAPTAHFIIDSRSTPELLLQAIEDILYGTDTTEPRLPSVLELTFMFDSFEASIIDAGTVGDPYFATVDAGVVPAPYTETIDGGSP